MRKTKWKYTKGNLIKRVWASFDGSAIMLALYVVFIMVATVIDLNYYELPTLLKWVFAPGTLITGIPVGESMWLGLPVIVIIISAIIWVGVGYLIDFLYDPYN